MTTSEAPTSQAATAVWRVLIDAQGPVTTGEVMARTGLTDRATLTALIRLRKNPRITFVPIGTDTLWSIQ